MALIKRHKFAKAQTEPHPTEPLSQAAAQEIAPENLASAEDFKRAEEIINEAEIQAGQIIETAKQDAEAQAAEILNAAEQQKIQLLSDLEQEKQLIESQKTELEKLKESEKSKAYEDGMQNAQGKIEELVKILGEFDRVKANILEEAEDEIISIAMAVAQKLLRKEISNDQEFLARSISESVAKVTAGDALVKIELNPIDAENKDLLLALMKDSLDPALKLTIIQSENVDHGSCVIETSGGRFDARFSTQIDVIKSAFAKYLGHNIDDLEELANRYKAMSKDAEFDAMPLGEQDIAFELSDLDDSTQEFLNDAEIFDEKELISLLDEEKKNQEPQEEDTKMDIKLQDTDIDFEADTALDSEEELASLDEDVDMGAVDDDIDFSFESGDDYQAFSDDDDDGGVDSRFPEY